MLKISPLPEGLKWYHPTAWIATVGFSGLITPANGTWGSLAGLALAFPIYKVLDYALNSKMQPQIMLFILLLATIMGLVATYRFTKYEKRSDDKRIVIDELVGMWIVMFGPWLTMMWIDDHHKGLAIFLFVLSFVLFRFFDILKPWPISWIDRNIKGSVGVMLDDILAGIAALFSWLLIIIILSTLLGWGI